jgi:hypothetical protein
MSREEQLSQFAAWVRHNITSDEKGQAQIFLDRLFQAFGQPGVLDVGGQIEFRLRKAAEDGGGTAFGDYVWKSVMPDARIQRGEHVTAPGVPKNYPEPAKFVINRRRARKANQ